MKMCRSECKNKRFLRCLTAYSNVIHPEYLQKLADSERVKRV